MKAFSNIVLFAVIFLSGFFSEADENSSLDPSLDSSGLQSQIKYFQQVAEPGLVRGLIEFPVYSFYLGAPDINGVAYVPNFSPRLGLDISWKEYGLIFSIALPLPKEEIDRRGNSDQFNFVINRYWRSYGLDLYYQQYRGFYVANPLMELDIQKPDRYPRLPDARVINYGFNFYQVLHPESYSLGASFGLSEIQVKGGGSWLATVFFNHLEIESGQAFLPGSDPSSMQTRPDLQSGTFQTIGGGGGYGHTWLRNQVFLTAQGIAGLGAQLQKIDEVVRNPESRIHVALKLNANLAVGYTSENYVIGGKVLADAVVSNIRNTQVYSTLINGQIFVGKRF